MKVSHFKYIGEWVDGKEYCKEKKEGDQSMP